MRQGFTLAELLIAIGVIVVIATFSTISILGKRNSTELNTTTQGLASLLREAQNRSINQSESTYWWVKLINPTSSRGSYALYSGSSTQFNFQTLPGNVLFATSSIAAGSSQTISFSQITGLPNASTSIVLRGASGLTSTIYISSSGLISY